MGRPRNSDYEPELIEAGIDWITFIADSRVGRDEVAGLADEIRREDLDTGSPLHDWRWMGYTGWRTASIRLGWRSASACLQATGPSAGFIATRMRSFSGRVTRLDVQATATLSSSLPSFVTRCISPSTRNGRSPGPCRGRIGLSRDSTGLAIGTVGARTGPRYLRVYDKGVEQRSHPPGVRWRLEVEAKQSLAEGLWADFQSQKDVPAWCYESVESQWRASGSRWLLPRSSRQRSAVRAVAKRPPTAVELLAWLRTTVAPTLPRVLKVYSAHELLGALGLHEVAMARPSSMECEDP